MWVEGENRFIAALIHQKDSILWKNKDIWDTLVVLKISTENVYNEKLLNELNFSAPKFITFNSIFPLTF